MSTMTKRRPFHSVSPYSRSRVVRARSSTIAVRWPTIRLKSVLLPTFGRPTMATTGSPPVMRDHGSGSAGRGDGARVRFGSDVVRPAGVAAPARAASASSRLGAASRASRRWPGSARRRRAGPRSASTCRRSRRRPARRAKTVASVEVGDALDLDRGRPGDLAQPGQLLRVRARAAADDDHQVDLAGRSRACPPGAGS